MNDQRADHDIAVRGIREAFERRIRKIQFVAPTSFGMGRILTSVCETLPPPVLWVAPIGAHDQIRESLAGIAGSGDVGTLHDVIEGNARRFTLASYQALDAKLESVAADIFQGIVLGERWKTMDGAAHRIAKRFAAARILDHLRPDQQPTPPEAGDRIILAGPTGLSFLERANRSTANRTVWP